MRNTLHRSHFQGRDLGLFASHADALTIENEASGRGYIRWLGKDRQILPGKPICQKSRWLQTQSHERGSHAGHMDMVQAYPDLWGTWRASPRLLAPERSRNSACNPRHADQNRADSIKPLCPEHIGALVRPDPRQPSAINTPLTINPKPSLGPEKLHPRVQISPNPWFLPSAVFRTLNRSQLIRTQPQRRSLLFQNQLCKQKMFPIAGALFPRMWHYTVRHRLGIVNREFLTLTRLANPFLTKFNSKTQRPTPNHLNDRRSPNANLLRACTAAVVGTRCPNRSIEWVLESRWVNLRGCQIPAFRQSHSSSRKHTTTRVKLLHMFAKVWVA